MKRFLKFVLPLVAIMCLAVVGMPTAQAQVDGPNLRVAHLAPGVAAVDVYVNNNLAVKALEYKVTTDYLPLMGEEFSVVVVKAGGKPESDALTKAPIMLKLTKGGYYTAVAVGSAADFDVVLLPADGKPAMAAAPEAGTATAGDIVITGAWARATKFEMGGMGGMSNMTPTPGMGGMAGMGGTGVSAAYMKIENRGAKPDRLIDVSTDVAGMAQLHETKMENDVAKMVHVPEGFEIPAGGFVELKQGGKHVMMMDLKRELLPDETITIVLTFESGLKINLVVPIKAPMAK